MVPFTSVLNRIKKLFLMPNYTDRGLIFWHWFYGMRFTPSITMKTNSVDQMYAVWNIGGVVGSPQNYRITSLRRRGSLVAILTFYKLFYSIQNLETMSCTIYNHFLCHWKRKNNNLNQIWSHNLSRQALRLYKAGPQPLVRVWKFQIQVALLSGRILVILHICSSPFLDLALAPFMYASITLIGFYVFYTS